MKTRKNILVISLFVSIISFVCILFLNDDSKAFQIMLAFMGSAFVAFLLEIPNYINLRKDHFSKLYWSLWWLKSHLTILNNTIENVLNSNDNIHQDFYVQSLNQINNDLYTLQNFDTDYYTSKTKKEECSYIIDNIRDKFNTLVSETSSYSIAYVKKKIELIQNNSITNNYNILSAEIMKKELTNISSFCVSYIESLDKQVEIIFSKKQFNKWKLTSEKINHMTETFKNN